MKPNKRILISLVILIVLVVVFYLVASGVTKYSGYSVFEQNSEFENCLSSQELVLYINATNSDEILINTGLIEYIQYFKIQNCILNTSPCAENNIEYFPSWIINGKKVVGEIGVSELAEYSGCKNE